MSHGGRRNGAGRPPGSASAKTREIANRAAEEGITPLEVMLETMRARWDSGDREGASQIAKDAAPYMHPRLTAVDATVQGELGSYEAQRIPVAERDSMDAAERAAGGGNPEALD